MSCTMVGPDSPRRSAAIAALSRLRASDAFAHMSTFERQSAIRELNERVFLRDVDEEPRSSGEVAPTGVRRPAPVDAAAAQMKRIKF